MPKVRRRKIGEILTSEGLITRDQLAHAMERQAQTGETLGEVLMAEGIVTETDIAGCLCIQYQMPFMRPSTYQLDPKLLDRFPGEFLYRHRIIPLDRIGDCAIVAIGEILDSIEIEHQLEKALEGKPFYYFAPRTEVEAILTEHFSLSEEAKLEIDHQKRSTRRSGAPEMETSSQAVPELVGAPGDGDDQPAPPVNLFETIEDDNSWAQLFDEAEKNIDNP